MTTMRTGQAYRPSVHPTRIPLGLRRLSGALGIAGEPRIIRMPPGFAGYHNVLVQDSDQAGGGSGFAGNLPLAVTKAFGEFIERRSLAGGPLPGQYRVGRRGDLPGPGLEPADVPLFTAWQLARQDFPWRGLRDDMTLDWVFCQGLGATPNAFLPTDFIWLRGASRVCLMGSTGTAAHVDPISARLAALYEIIERDALSIVWETRAVTPLLDPNADWQVPETRHLIAILRGLGQDIHLRDLTTDLSIPVVAAVLTDREGRRPCLALGTAAALDLAEATRKALLEAASVWLWMVDEHQRLDLDLAAVRRRADPPLAPMWQAVLYGFAEPLAAAAPLTLPSESSPRRPTADSIGLTPIAALTSLLTRLSEAGISVYAHAILAEDLAGLGWVVERVIAPKLVPLGFGARCRPLGNPRLNFVPAACSWRLEAPHDPWYRPPVPLP